MDRKEKQRAERNNFKPAIYSYILIPEKRRRFLFQFKCKFYTLRKRLNIKWTRIYL